MGGLLGMVVGEGFIKVVEMVFEWKLLFIVFMVVGGVCM